MPQYTLVSDFQRFRLHDLDGREPHVEFPLADLHREIGGFGFISGYQRCRGDGCPSQEDGAWLSANSGNVSAIGAASGKM